MRFILKLPIGLLFHEVNIHFNTLNYIYKTVSITQLRVNVVLLYPTIKAKITTLILIFPGNTALSTIKIYVFYDLYTDLFKIESTIITII